MQTDFEALAAMTDDDIDCSDIPEITDEEIENAPWFICKICKINNKSKAYNNKFYVCGTCEKEICLYVKRSIIKSI